MIIVKYRDYKGSTAVRVLSTDRTGSRGVEVRKPGDTHADKQRKIGRVKEKE